MTTSLTFLGDLRISHQPSTPRGYQQTYGAISTSPSTWSEFETVWFLTSTKSAAKPVNPPAIAFACLIKFPVLNGQQSSNNHGFTPHAQHLNFHRLQTSPIFYLMTQHLMRTKVLILILMYS
ncbi:hypothetical protein Fcan01_19201 [Folsomia candida]|uniref:Uncharacterized protein n=1 Tax=Folsomia candida TaxID=158441 RepID=A0A226DL08_FOLCA|nr:hypothetical protein Fcan01_19201 [Folsomia candida]